MSASRIVPGTALLVLTLSSCGDGQGRNTSPLAAAPNDPRASAEALPEAVQWSASASVDPMTDAATQTATVTIRGAQFDIEVRISCRNDGRIEYSLNSFDKEGQPADMRSSTALYGNSANRRVDFQVRAGTAQPFSFSVTNPRYVNQVTFATGSQAVGQYERRAWAWEEYALRVAGSDRVTVRLVMLSGDETVRIDQTGPIVRRVLDPCLEELARLRQQSADNESRRVAEQDEQQRREAEERRASNVTSGM